MNRYLVEIPSTARPEITDAEVLRCLRERFPEADVWADKPDGELIPLTRTNPWKGE